MAEVVPDCYFPRPWFTAMSELARTALLGIFIAVGVIVSAAVVMLVVIHYAGPRRPTADDYGKTVAISDRQEIAVDDKGQIRRRCEQCIIKFDKARK